MNEIELSPEATNPPAASGGVSFLYRQLPYLIVLVLAIVGVAYTNMSHEPLVGYWEFLTLAMGAVCVVTEWPKADDRQARVQRNLRQVSHWGTGASDVAGARHFSRRPQSFMPPNLLLGGCHGRRRAGDRLVQANGAVFAAGCRAPDWAWLGLLASRSARRACGNVVGRSNRGVGRISAA